MEGTNKINTVYCSMVILFNILRLVNSQNYSLGLYVEKGPTYIYQGQTHSRVSFALHIPDFVNDIEAVELIRHSAVLIHSVNISSLYEQDVMNKNLASLFKTIVDISNTFLTVRTKLKELSTYRLDIAYPDGLINQRGVDEARCHLNFRSIFSRTKLDAFKLNLEILVNSLNKKITFAELTKENGQKYLVFRQTLQEILALINVFAFETGNYVDILQNLSRHVISKNLFSLLKDSRCFDSNPYMDLLLVKECTFYTNNVTCEMVSTSPQYPEKIGELIALPYFGYELDISNFFLNYSTNQIIYLTCKEYDPVKLNCKVEYNIQENCIDALHYGYLTKILEECSFKRTTLTTPVITNLGILIPNEELIPYGYTSPENKTKIEIFQNMPPPVIIHSTTFLEVRDDQYVYTYQQFYSFNMIYYTEFSSHNLAELYSYVEAPIYLSGEGILTVTQSLMGVLAAGLMFVVMNLTRKLYLRNKILKQIQGNKKGSYSKELTNFLGKK